MSMANIPKDIVTRLKACTSFPTPPAVAMQIVELAQNPEIDLATVANAVSTDPAIASKVMRIANSALYARRRQSSNLRQALIVLGLNATLTLALSFTIVNNLRGAAPRGFDFTAYWRRALLAATWGKLIAGETGRRDAEEIFLGALLQDIGMLAIDKIAPEVYEGIAPFEMDHAQIIEHEKSIINTDHRAIGAWLLDSWNMPEQLIRAVKFSHDVTAAGVAQEHRDFTRTIVLSGELADVWLHGADEVAIRRVAAQAHRHLGILQNRLGEMFGIISTQLPVAQEIFEMDLLDGSQAQDIASMAGEILMVRNLHTLSEVAELQKQTTDLKSENNVLKEESNRDGLTGVLNRRGFEESLEREFQSAAEHSWPLSIIFVDLDNFKHINDNYGHPVGDAILKKVAELLTANLRETDMVGRYGGDEYVLLLPGVDADRAEQVAARVVAEARKQGVRSDDGASVGITLSVGLATFDSRNSFESPKDLLSAADVALYHSKRNGRNRHTCFQEIAAA